MPTNDELPVIQHLERWLSRRFRAGPPDYTLPPSRVPDGTVSETESCSVTVLNKPKK